MAGKFYKLIDRCSFATLPGEGLILDPGNRTYYHVNETASILLHAMNAAALAGGGISFENLVTLLKFYYFGVDEEKAKVFLDQMEKAKLIELVPTEAPIPVNAALQPWERTEIKNFVPPSHKEYGSIRRIMRMADLKAFIPPVFFPPKPPKILKNF